MMLFKRRFSNVHITIYKLRKLYRTHKIKKKKIRKVKTHNTNTEFNILEAFIHVAEDLRSAILQGFQIVQIDEMMVTKNTLPTHDWSKLNHNTSIDIAKTNITPIAVVGAVSREDGINLIMTFPKSLNIKKFKVFLEQLRSKYPFSNMILMMDNLSLHKSKVSVARMDELGFRYCWTPPYSPETNGIEEVWSQSKRYIKE